VTNRIDIEQGLVFDEVAELYDRVRPGYPDSFVDEVCRRASLEPGARILEIGCGPGIATRSFAQRGYAMLCLEPGPRLAEVARSRLAEHPAVSVLTTTFEAWPSPSGANGEFALVLAAQSFHWVDLAVGFSKAAAVLRPGGHLAIIANLPQPGESEVRAALDRVYARFGDAFSAHAQASGQATRARLDELLAQAPEFGAVETVSEMWTARYGTATYLELMQTQSDHRMLPEETRRELLGAIAEVIDAHGGSFDLEYEARLLLAERL
jgi:SAM-dependent methyltransferase